MTVRPLQRGDRPFVERLLHDTNVFNEAEIVCALELIDITFNVAEQRDYHVFCAVDDKDRVQGYVCFGPTPLTDALWDLYWIAVAPDQQKRGIGALLLKFVESYVRERAGRRLVIETSSLPRYEPTRAFYDRHGYAVLARIADFYAIGDDRVIFGKDFSPLKKA
jgi:ribosomal protein S18 acetylase RimI-like enzyme